MAHSRGHQDGNACPRSPRSKHQPCCKTGGYALAQHHGPFPAKADLTDAIAHVQYFYIRAHNEASYGAVIQGYQPLYGKLISSAIFALGSITKYFYWN